MFEKFPYTNLHELNLDWIIKITQDFLEQYTSIQQVISDGESALNEIISNGDTSLHEIIATGENSIAQLTATKIQELNTEKNRLEALLQAWYDTHSQDIADQLADALADMTTHYNGLVADLNTLNTQIQAAIQQKGIDTLATIPSDYTALYNTVVDLRNNLNEISEVLNIGYVTDNAIQIKYGTTVSKVEKNKIRVVNDGESNGTWYANILNGVNHQSTAGPAEKQFPAGTYTFVANNIPYGVRFIYTTSTYANKVTLVNDTVLVNTITVNEEFAIALNVLSTYQNTVPSDIEFAIYNGTVENPVIYEESYTALDIIARKELQESLKKTDIVDNLNSTQTDKPLSANQGRVLKGLINANELPSYVQEEVNIISDKVQNKLSADSICFALYTDLHYQTIPTDHDMHDYTCMSMRKLADKTPIDFTVNGGDLYDGSTYDTDRSIINRSEYFTSGQRCPHLYEVGDHDRNQNDIHIYSENIISWVMPYMNNYNIVRPTDKTMAKHFYYYYDIPNKTSAQVKTRVVIIGNSIKDAEVKSIYKWLKEDVFTENVKEGYQFIILCHIPIDVDSLAGYAHAGGNSPSRLQWNYHRLFDAINNATTFVYDYNSYQTVYYDSNNRITQDSVTGTAFTMSNMSDTPNTNANPGEYGTMDFTGWTSKIRLVVSGHNHCDRFGYRSGGEIKSYLTAYTAQANRVRPASSKPSSWYEARFGNEREIFNEEVSTDGIVWWTDIDDAHRVENTIDEYLYDVYIVTESAIKRVRFGCGRDMET